MTIVIGTGGLTKQCIHLISALRDDLIFFDNTEGAPDSFYHHKVIHDLSEINEEKFDFIVGIGNPQWRAYFYDLLIEKHNGFPVNLISKKSTISKNSNIGWGNIILDYVLIETNTIIGEGNLINAYAGIFHDVVIGEFNEIMPGAKILGCAKIGNRCRIGTNSTILPHVGICDNVVIGAGTVVNKSITEPGTYVGVPFRKIK
jgi:sugar O-acyltransferase (sialic acid O-acetyltransferase NeuD family)